MHDSWTPIFALLKCCLGKNITTGATKNGCDLVLKLCAFGEPEDEFAVAFEEVVVGEEVGVLPENLLKFVVYRDAGEVGDVEEDQIHRGTLIVAELIALELCSDDGFDAEFFAEFAGQGFFWSFAEGRFSRREIPT